VISPVGSVAPPIHVSLSGLQFKFRVLTGIVHTEIAKNDYSSREDASSETDSSVV
jgi:hypothetical protein